VLVGIIKKQEVVAEGKPGLTLLKPFQLLDFKIVQPSKDIII